MIMLVIRPVALVLLVLALFGCGGDNATYVRVRNGSDKDFVSVMVNDNNFGDIKAGEVSEYQILPMAYPDPYVKATVGNERLKFEPAKYQGEQQLGPGRFTYAVTLQDKKLSVKSEKDK
jgi:hypothetical protein